MQTIWDKTDQELQAEIAKGSKTDIERQTIFLMEILKQIGLEVQKNKSVTVENIVRQVVGKVSVERPEWIKELKTDLAPLSRKLDYIASAIIRKEVVRKMDFNRPEWIDEIKPKDIVFPEQKEAEKINPFLKEILQAIKGQEFPEFPKEIEIKEPSWWKLPDFDKPILSLATFIKKLVDKTTFKTKIENEITIANPVNEITVKNPQKEVKITNLDKLEKNTELMTVQLRALGTTGGSGGSAVDTSSLATEENQDKLASYKTQALDDFTTANVSYVCKMKPAGTWLFIKIDETGNFPTFTYANVSNNGTKTTYALAYADRTTLTYGLLNTLTL